MVSDGTKFAYSLISPKPGTDQPTHYGDIVVANADGSNLITIDRDTVDPARCLVARRPMACLFEGRRSGRPDLHRSGRRQQPTDPDRRSRHDQLVSDLSPDGSKILYFRGDSHVAVMDRNGSNDRPLNTTAFTAVQSLAWHPDGNRVVVSASTTEATDLWFLYLDGTPERQLRLPGRAEVGPSWSPDGNRLVYLLSVDPRGFMPVVADADGTNSRTLPGVYGEINPAWSPDGRLIAVVNDLGPVGYVDLIDPYGERDPIRNESVAPVDPGIADRSSPVRWQRLAP